VVVTHRVPLNGERIKRKYSKEYEHGKPTRLLGANAESVSERRTVERMTVRDVHHLAVAALRHFAKHGDSTQMARLIQSLVTPVWKKQLIGWCQKHAGVPWNLTRNGFRGGPPKEGVRLLAAEQEPFRKLPKHEGSQSIGIQVDILWSTPRESSKPCRVCGTRSIPGENSCYGHHNK